jgi:hypothetical protein
MDFPQKTFYGVFELPLLRNAQTRHKQKVKKLKKKGTYLPHLVAICQIYVALKQKKPLAPLGVCFIKTQGLCVFVDFLLNSFCDRVLLKIKPEGARVFCFVDNGLL